MNRLALPALALLLLAGCGPVGGGLTGSTPAAATSPTGAANPSRSVSATPGGPPPVPEHLAAGSTTLGVGSTYYDAEGVHLALLLPDGIRKDIVLFSPTAEEQPSVDIAAVDGGVVAAAQGRFIELRADGSRLDLGPVPSLLAAGSNLDGGFAVSPDGTEVAFATVTATGPSIDNRLYVTRIGGTPKVLTDRTSVQSVGTPAPSADAPPFWSYSVRRWTRQGILIVRGPNGVGGGGPFLSYDWYTALIDPDTGAATDLTDSTATPLSSYSDTGQWVAVNWAGASDGGQYTGATATRMLVGDIAGSVRAYPLDPANLAGDAVLDSTGEHLAYATLGRATWTAHENGTQGWLPLYRLHVLDLATGQDRVVGGAGLDPVTWTGDGRILATRWPAGSGNGTTYVIVDPSSGAVTPLGAIPQATTVVVTTPPGS